MSLARGKFGSGNSKGGKGHIAGKSCRFLKKQTARWARRLPKDQKPESWGKGFGT